MFCKLSTNNNGDRSSTVSRQHDPCVPDDYVQGLMLHHHRLDILSAPHTLQCTQYRGHLSWATWIKTPTIIFTLQAARILLLCYIHKVHLNLCWRSLFWRPRLKGSSAWRLPIMLWCRCSYLSTLPPGSKEPKGFLLQRFLHSKEKRLKLSSRDIP